MPPVTDFIHRYCVPPNTIEAKCRIRVYQLANGIIVVIATELPDNAGASITNAAEILATEMRRWFVVPGGGLFWIEHYQDRAVIDGRPRQKRKLRPRFLPLGWGAVRRPRVETVQPPAG